MRKLIYKIYSYKFIRYSLGWWIAALLDLLLLYIGTDKLGLYYLYSAIFAFVISVTFAYFFQKYITFRNYSKKHLLQGSLFLWFQIIGQIIYMSMLRIGVDTLHIYYMLVAIIAKWIVFLRNYISNHYFNFKQ